MLTSIEKILYWFFPQLNREAGRREPDPAHDRMIAYADGVNWNPGSGKGFYQYAAATKTWRLVARVTAGTGAAPASTVVSETSFGQSTIVGAIYQVV